MGGDNSSLPWALGKLHLRIDIVVMMQGLDIAYEG
jgi:hypothetical protein